MQAAKQLITEKLQPIYPPHEVESITLLILEHVLGLSRLEIRLRHCEKIPAAKLTQIEEIVNRLIRMEPIQYVLGETEFYGLKIKVNPAVLIPRPETEELVDWVIREKPARSSSLLDIGTGSGCIPISIAKNSNYNHVEGWDISGEALAVARENAEANKARVDFFQRDILQWHNICSLPSWDTIVSNPPYVTCQEKRRMENNVLDHEPHLALFVPDNDPLVFYRAILEFAGDHLARGGQLFFEINEGLGEEMVQLIQSYGFLNIILRKDINGKDRMVKASHP